MMNMYQRAIAASAHITHFLTELEAVEDYTRARFLTEGERVVLREARSILNELYLELTDPQKDGTNE